MNWWRLVVDDSGKLVSCVRVERAAEDGATVYYIRAATQADAEREAANRYYAANNRRRRARYDAEGRCKCGRKRDSGEFKTCSECRRLALEYDARAKAKKRGEPVPTRERVVAVQQRKATEAEQARLTVLLEVQDAWLSQPTNRQFTAWLTAQIAALAGKRVA